MKRNIHWWKQLGQYVLGNGYLSFSTSSNRGKRWGLLPCTITQLQCLDL